MKRGLLVAVGGAAIVVAGMSGCSSDKSASGSSSSSKSSTVSASASASVTASVPGGGTASVGSGTTKVTIDGKDQAVTGSIVCTVMGGNTNIAIGEGATGIAAVLGAGDTPTVASVALGNIKGVTLAYQAGTGQSDGKVEKSGNTYKITGTATGIDMANPTTPVNKPFAIEVACP